ncbi:MULTISPECIES: glycosyltransferase [unclassified Halomonas]|uniref:glycosyltransferase n=1 Tax=unclassified Halomonas TaxID=2609666 RepID=UPI0007D9ED6B|nr:MULTISPECIES: glycosyltransferase [unclassified Halomonas]MBT2785330.1 glycosyltransferase [Halomonas sp. ISL-106]MBT2799351.1 glycosyltransferase [Halomonas sp. ISL-104]OAL59608.1 glycosyl transferase family 1 [Halomonas sp. ALS9]
MSQRFTLIVAGDPDQRTGGYLYDAHIVSALRDQGWAIDVVGLAGAFPDADAEAAVALAQTLDALPDHAAVVIDGLAMGALPEIVAQHAQRLDITALLHHPLGDELGLDEVDQQRFHRSELTALAPVARIIVTSHFTARRLPELATRYALPLNASVSVVEPGVAQAPISRAAAPGETLRLLCVATLTPRKGQDILVQALAGVAGDHWQCDCYGGARDPDFTQRVAQLIEQNGLQSSVHLHGECDSETLEAAYRGAHALVLPSWYEGYGMVITEALAHGLPVITTTGGALRDTLPKGAGLSVEPGDVDALKDAVSHFCHNEELRQQLRQGAAQARNALSDWQAAGVKFAAALTAPSDTASLRAGSQFESDWLALREEADVASRSQHLAALAAEWLSERTPAPQIADLGCGRGSNLRFLAPHLSGQQRWKLIDHDAILLAQARQRAAGLSNRQGQPVAVESHCVSLEALTDVPLDDAHLVTASALLDLVSQQWVNALVARIAGQQQALLIALSVTGEWHFIDPHGKPMLDDEDHWLRALFIAHQQRNKGLGDALGGQAHQALASALEEADYSVEQAETPWQFAAGSHAQKPLMMALLDGWADAATEQAPQAAVRIAAWLQLRQRAVVNGQLGIWVGHRDLFAKPKDEA